MRGSKRTGSSADNLYIDARKVEKENGDRYLSFVEFAKETKSRTMLKNIGHYREVVLFCKNFHRIPRTFFALMSCRLMASERTVLINEESKEKIVTMPYLAASFLEMVRDLLLYRPYLKATERHINELRATQYDPELDLSGVPFYLFSYYGNTALAGGMLGHVAGIVNHIGESFGGGICFVTSDHFPTVREDIEQHKIGDGDKMRFSNLHDVPSLYFNKFCLRALEEAGLGHKPALLYHRSALNAWAGLEYALQHRVPYVLEYNGSDVWTTENWGGRRLATDRLSREIEQLSLEKASLIVCVSKALEDELLRRGIDREKILVIPNGVDTAMYHPEIDGVPVRARLSISEDNVVIGFIGTFGPWHGAEVLAQAAVQIAKRRKDIIFLFIGDGVRLTAVKEIVAKGGAEEACRFTGVVPQTEGRFYLAACDILASPQVPNPDGTPFFGSPTKLFEYMAMGKAIVVSDMDQMAEICVDGETALLSAPGDVEDLQSKIEQLCDDKPLRERLGKNARRDACENHTWEQQAKSIAEAVIEKFSGKRTNA